MIPVRQSTAFECSIGPVLDADGVAVTDCVVGDFKIKKTTGNFAALNGSATLTHVSAGTYDLVLTTSDLDTVGLATVAIDDTVNACAPVRLQVVEEAIYDALFASAAAGYQVPIWAAANSTVNLSGTTVKTATDVETDTADIQSRLPAALTAGGNMKADSLAFSGSTTAADNAEVVFATDFATNYDTTNDKWQVLARDHTAAALATAASLASLVTTVGVAGAGLTEAGGTGDHLTDINLPDQTMNIVGNITGNLSGSVGSVTGAVGSVTGNVGGNVVGSVGSISGVTFPSNFAALGINASGHVSRVTLTDTLTTYTGNTPQTGDTYALANGASGFAATKADTAAIKAKTDNLPASPAAVGSAMTLTSGERDAIAAALLDLANGIESGKTLRQALRLMAAALAGKRSNSGTLTEQFDAIGNPGTARIVSNADAAGDGTPTLTP